MVPSLTLYEQFLSLPLWVELLWIAIPVFAITVGLTLFSLRKDPTLRGDDNVATAGLQFVGAAFIFIGSFSVVTGWQGSALVANNLANEFAAATTVAEEVLRVESPEGRAITATMLEYAHSVRETELGAHALPGPSREAEDLISRVSNEVQAFEDLPILTPKQNETLNQALNTFIEARHTRISTVWPLVPETIFNALLVIALIVLVAVGLYPAGPRRWLKWVQTLTSGAIIVTVMMTVILVQVSNNTGRQFRESVDLFISYYSNL
jgi:hypothetical protein